MGLNIYPGNASWPYSGFNDFRRRLAAEEGIDLDEMRGFGGEREWTFASGNSITTLAPLLNHSDCEGYLEDHECEEVLPRLRRIIEKWAAADDYDPVREYDVQQARQLIAAMEHSIDHGCAVVFS